MKAITTQGWGLNPKLVLSDFDEPKPGPNDLLVEVHASSVNPKDWKLNYSLARALTPVGTRRVRPLFGDDLAGVVLAVGAKVQGFKPDDRVYGMDMRLRTAALAERAVIDLCRVALMPANLSFEQAASVPLAALTALQGLRKGKAQAGSKVLIIGASGGVGTFAVQVAKAMGCQVTGVCSGRNAELVKSLGADAVIDYTQGDYRQTSGEFDVVFDVTSYETPKSCKALMGQRGYFISTAGQANAYLGMASAKLGLFSQVNEPRAQFIFVESYTRDLDTLRAWIEAGQVKPVIDSVFDFEHTDDAYARSKSGRARGKVVVKL